MMPWGNAMKWWAALFVFSLIAAVPAAARACPNCKEAVESGESGDDDPLREARGYNNSIYLMASMPYLLLGTLGAAGYRAYRKAQAAQPPSEG